MTKPRLIDCKKYCHDYKTCSKAHDPFAKCNKRKGWKADSNHIEMLDNAIYINYKMKLDKYRKMGDLIDNGNNFRRCI